LEIHDGGLQRRRKFRKGLGNGSTSGFTSRFTSGLKNGFKNASPEKQKATESVASWWRNERYVCLKRQSVTSQRHSYEGVSGDVEDWREN
jgi:hypothetical protein